MSSAFRSCRNVLDTLPDTNFSHPGLALSRYLKQQDDTEAIPLLLEGVTASRAGEPYKAAFQRWKRYQEASATTFTFSGMLAAPMAIGLGNESALETGLTLHHTYGMPVIPGTALKGLCRRGAEKAKQDRQLSDNQIQALFGDTSSAGFCTFQDAWYDSESVGGKPFKRDVVTVHHPNYYRNREKAEAWPTDFDDPIPIPFLVVKPDAQFFFSLSAPEGWGDFVRNLLCWSLAHLGIGAKTAAGYGYFDNARWIIPPPPPPPAREEVWHNCTIKQANNKGVLTATISSGQNSLDLAWKEWATFREHFDSALREQLKKRSILADVTVEVQGEHITVQKIEPKG